MAMESPARTRDLFDATRNAPVLSSIRGYKANFVRSEWGTANSASGSSFGRCVDRRHLLKEFKTAESDRGVSEQAVCTLSVEQAAPW